MKRTPAVLILVFVFPVSRLALGLEFQLVRSFSTQELSEAPPRSIAVVTPQDRYFLAFETGQVLELTRRWSLVKQVTEPAIFDPANPTARHGRFGHGGLTYIPHLDGFADFRLPPAAIQFFDREGVDRGFVAPFGFANYTGIYFERTDVFGNLHTFLNDRQLVVYRIFKEESVNRFTGFRSLLIYHLPRKPGDERSFPVWTGMTYIPSNDLHVFAHRFGELRVTDRGTFDPPSRTWFPSLRSITNLRPHGVTSVSDITWDPVEEQLYVVDPDAFRVFVFELSADVPVFHRGDSDGNGRIDMADAVLTLEHLFRRGPAPGCLEAADANNDGRLNVVDAILLIQHAVLGVGDRIPAPGPPGAGGPAGGRGEAGAGGEPRPCGPEPDLWDAHTGLGCERYDGCE